MDSQPKPNWVQRAMAGLMKPTCPKCQAPADPADISVEDGSVFCRSCGERFFPGDGRETDAEPDAQDALPPTRPDKPRVRTEEVGGELILDRSCANIALGVFLTFWLAGWTYGLVIFVPMHLRHPSPGGILFELPFVIAWFVSAAIWVHSFFGRERISVSPGGVSYQRSAGVVFRRAWLPSDRPLEVHIGTKVVSGEHGSTRYPVLEISGGDKTIRYGQGVDPEELRWLAAIVRQHLPGAVSTQAPVVEAEPKEDPDEAGDPSTIEVLRPSGPARTVPGNSTVTLSRDAQSITFTRRTPFRSVAGGFVFLTLFNAIWNGGIAVGVVQSTRRSDLFGTLFLVPFVLVGLAVFALWLATLAAPFGREVWSFRAGEGNRRYSLIGIGKTRQFPVTQVARLELRSIGTKRRPGTQGDSGLTASEFSLAVVGIDGRDIIAFGQLTEEEARWIADELFRAFQGWFTPVGARG